MTLGEIKLQTLRLMFMDAEGDITLDNLPELYDSVEYRGYLNGMNGSINRALARIERAGAMPLNRRKLERNEGVEGRYYTTYNLANIIPDYSRLDRVISEIGYSYNGNYPYRLEGDVLILPNNRNLQNIYLIYVKKVPWVSESTRDDTELDMPDYLSSILPYYIKADLWEEEEPELANHARNIFEKALEESVSIVGTGTASIISMFGGTI